MRKGTIIRRKLLSGEPCGGFLMVDRALQDRVDAHVLSTDSNNTYLLFKNHVYECSVLKLQVSTKDYDRATVGEAEYLIHDATMKWINAANNIYDVVILYDSKNRRAFFQGCEFVKIIRHMRNSKPKPMVRLYLGHSFYTQ